MRSVFHRVLFAVLAAVGGANTAAAQFTPGTLIVLRVGNGFAAGNASRPGTLQEFPLTATSSTTPTLSVPIPSTGTNAVSFNGGGDALLSLSGNGQFLVTQGYNAPAGTASVVSATLTHSIVRVSPAGAVDATTKFTLAATGRNSYGAASPDGIRFYASTSDVTNSLGTTTLGSTAALTTVVNGNGLFAPTIQNNQLHFIDFDRVKSTTPALPTALASGTNTLTVGSTIASGYVLLDRDAGVAGPDTLYMATDSGLEKFSFNGTTWTARGVLAGPSTSFGSIIGRVNGSNAELYLVDGLNPNNGIIVKYTDTAVSAANLPANTFTQFGVAAGANNSYGGLAFAPAMIPEPALAGALLLGCAALLRRCR